MIKKLILYAFLMSCSFITFSKENIVNVQKAKRIQGEKITELASINQKISDKEEIIDVLTKKSSEIYYEIRGPLESNESKKFTDEINAYEEKIYCSLFSLAEIRAFLAQEFFTDINKHRDLIRRIKFLLIRRKIEYVALNNLFDNYQKCLEELLGLNNDLLIFQELM